MAATGKTPILLYGSTTATNQPSAGNLTNSSDGCEIAINVADKNLFFKDATNTVNTVPIRQSSASSNGWLSSTDWSTFNSKQPAGTYVTSVTGTAPVVSSGGTTPAISMAAATGSVNGYLTSTDWTTFNSKQTALVSGTNIKTVNGTSLLGSGDVGTIDVSHGGTGQTSFTAGYIPWGNGTSGLATSANLYFDGDNLCLGNTTSAFGVLNVNKVSGGQSLITIGDFATPANAIGMYFRANGTGACGISTAGAPIALSVANNLGNIGLQVNASGGVSIGNTTDPGAGNLSVNGVATVGSGASLGAFTIRSSFNTWFDSGNSIYFDRNGANYIVANGGTSANIQVISNTNGVYLPNGATAWTSLSDETLKDIIEPITNAADKISTLRAVIGKYKTDSEETRRPFLIAQDIQKVLPEAVNPITQEDETEVLGLSYTEVIPLLVAAIKELKQEFDAYKALHL